MKLGNHRNHSLEIRISDLKSRTRFSKVLDPSTRAWNHINLHRFHRHSQYKAHQALGVYLAAQWHRKGLKKATANVNNKEITILTINTAHVGYNNWLFNTLACAVTRKNRNFSRKKNGRDNGLNQPIYSFIQNFHTRMRQTTWCQHVREFLFYRRLSAWSSTKKVPERLVLKYVREGWFLRSGGHGEVFLSRSYGQE